MIIKQILLTLFSLMVCCNVFVVAQYPKDEIVDPYPLPIKERSLVKRFECDVDQFPQWQSLHQASIFDVENRLRIESTGTDPYILMPEMPQAEAGVFEFRIRMKNGMTPKAEIFWSTEKEPNFCAENTIRLNFVKDFERFETYSVRFETDAPPTRLRFDPGTSEGVCEIEWAELDKIVYDKTKKNHTLWYDPNWAEKVESWETISSENIVVRLDGAKVTVKIDAKGAGAQIFLDEKHVGDVYPLAYLNPALPLAGSVPSETKAGATSGPLAVTGLRGPCKQVEFILPGSTKKDAALRFGFTGDGDLHFGFWASGRNFSVFGPVFRPIGEMQQAVLCGVEYLEKGEHSSATADIETKEHLRFAPKPLDVTWPFMAIVTENVGFALFWDEPETVYQILVNGERIVTVESKGIDHIEL